MSEASAEFGRRSASPKPLSCTAVDKSGRVLGDEIGTPRGLGTGTRVPVGR